MEFVENASKLPSLWFSLLRKGDLLYHEMSLLVHFVNRDKPSEHFIYKWSDWDETANRWLVFKVSAPDFLAFFEKQLTLRQLIEKNPFVFLLDLDKDINVVQTLFVPINNVPKSYFPRTTSFYDENQYEDYAAALRKSLSQSTAGKKIQA